MVSDVAAVPALTVNVPLVASVPVPVMVLLPLTPKVMPPLAVILLLLKPTLPDELVKLKLPEPRLSAGDVIPPMAFIVMALGDPDTVPIVILVAPCVIVTAPVSSMLTVGTFVETVVAPLPEVNDRAPVDVRTPEPVMVALPLVPVDNVIPPLAVTVLATDTLPAFVVTENDPAPSLLLSS